MLISLDGVSCKLIVDCRNSISSIWSILCTSLFKTDQPISNMFVSERMSPIALKGKLVKILLICNAAENRGLLVASLEGLLSYTRLMSYCVECCLLFSRAQRNVVSVLLIAPILIRCVPDSAAQEVQRQKSVWKIPVGNIAAWIQAENHQAPSENGGSCSWQFGFEVWINK